MKNKKVIIIVICIISVLLLVTGLSFVSTNQKNDNIEKEQTLCEKIGQSKNKESNFIVIITNKNNTNGDLKDAIIQFKKNYESELFYELEVQEINNSCFEELFTDTGIYNDIKNIDTSVILGYKDGNYVGILQNAMSEFEIERYLIEQKVISKKVINENITFSDYEKNCKDEYLLLIISDENAHKEVSLNMEKVFPNIKQDTINKNSDLGIKIVNELNEKTELLNVYPQLFYIKNNKVIVNDKVFSEKSFSDFKSQYID